MTSATAAMSSLDAPPSPSLNDESSAMDTTTNVPENGQSDRKVDGDSEEDMQMDVDKNGGGNGSSSPDDTQWNQLNGTTSATSKASMMAQPQQQAQTQEEYSLQNPRQVSEEKVGGDGGSGEAASSSNLSVGGHPAATAAAAAAAADGPLPKDLTRILQVVAKTGTCPWLPWEDKDDNDDDVSEDKNKMIDPGQMPTAPSGVGSCGPGSSSSTPSASSKVIDMNTQQAPSSIPFAPSVGSGGLPSSRSQTEPWKRDNASGVGSGFGNRSSPFSSSSPHPSIRLSGLSQTYSSTSMTGSAAVAASTQAHPPRKKHRNGIHKGSIGGSKRRFGKSSSGGGRTGGGGGSTTTTTTTTSPVDGGGNVNRKRPLYLIRTSGHNSAYPSAPGSIGSGRTSGSEVEDSTQYEYDSEATSATTNSEISIARKKTHSLGNLSNADQHNPKSLWSTNINAGQGGGRRKEMYDANMRYKSLQMALRVATGIVLDHFYNSRGGYTLSPAEKRRNESSVKKGDGNSGHVAKDNASSKSEDLSGCNRSMPSSEEIYQQRRQRLLQMLNPPKSEGRMSFFVDEGPPFTIQRIAEVLLAPARYYTQTHKLCNCLEKLLLVRLSTEAFGGSTGGATSQSRKEEQELAALDIAKELEESRLRQRRLKKRTSSPSDEMVLDGSGTNRKMPATFNLKKADQNVSDSIGEKTGMNKMDARSSENQQSRPHDRDSSDDAVDASSRELVEAAKEAAKASLRTKFDHIGNDPHSNVDRDVRAIAANRGLTNSPPPPSLAMSAAPSNLARVPSPILFNSGSPTGSEKHLAPTTTNMQMLQLHHSMTMAGVPLNRANTSPLDLMTIDSSTIAQMRSQTNASAPGSEGGRSSASNSDIDSESDDISFDDSASDRSDGSDTGPISAHHEPFTAARAMALNRMQQQQRLQQSRARTSLTSLHQNEGFRPPADSEYQSGDSIDSTRAEDSEGSDSSDMAD
eukprot:CAMPEP_0113503356 /NCGR_PEP_ID=MMETSP0014_2-20120614/34097_1 /TAXON_ID=2857 /ORGANISM="Nitzschia sp." /LENGTH=969 /DNA_ID=CAMNT_0000398311 /DNA_START=149 /DNA_END=3058 /DNA_ORIENTATION=- /assembly_acc=CAM_ASM_000159